MLIEEIIEFELKDLAPLVVRNILLQDYNKLFSWQNKNLQGKSSSGLLFSAKILQVAIIPNFS